MSLAAGGSSAAPVFFEPQKSMDEYGIQQLVIDGGIIGNNPALFAYNIATKLNKKGPKIRILSLGTGMSEVIPIDTETFTRFDWLKMTGDMMIEVDVFSSDKIL